MTAVHFLIVQRRLAMLRAAAPEVDFTSIEQQLKVIRTAVLPIRTMKSKLTELSPRALAIDEPPHVRNQRIAFFHRGHCVLVRQKDHQRRLDLGYQGSRDKLISGRKETATLGSNLLFFVVFASSLRLTHTWGAVTKNTRVPECYAIFCP